MQYVVTVHISGLFTDVTNIFNLSQFNPSNLNLVGASQTTDGFTGTVNVLAGGFCPHLLQFGSLQCIQSGTINATGKTIRVGSNATGTYWGLFCEGANASITLINCTIEYSQNPGPTVGNYGSQLWIRQCNFVAIGTINRSPWCLSQGGTVTFYSGGATKTVNITNASTGALTDSNNGFIFVAFAL